MTRTMAVAVLALLCACGGAAPAGTVPATTGGTVAPTLPAGELAVVPIQYRDDEVAGRMQLEVVNGTADTLHVVAVQFAWAGFTTEVVERQNAVAPGQRVDFPVPVPPASCHGDGGDGGDGGDDGNDGDAAMPDVRTAVARLTLAGGDVREVPVFDIRGVAAALYRRDCERQVVASAVTMEWTGLARVEVDGRPMTAGALTLTRGAAAGDVAVLQIGSTITYLVVPATAAPPATPPAAPPAAPLVVLPAGTTSVSLPVVFEEGRCDAHALAEAKQPFRFVLQVDLGDGIVHPYILEPPAGQQEAMRATVFDGCVALGLVEPLG